MNWEIVHYYSEIYDEGRRVHHGEHRFEFLRTKEIISRHLDRAPLTVIDAGGGTGPYARWLTELGHRVHLLDVTQRHVAAARSETEEHAGYHGTSTGRCAGS